MPPSETRCADPRLYLLALAVAATQAYAQADERDKLIEDLRRRVDTLERRLAPAPASKPVAEQAAAKEDDERRALERTLTREGGLLLRPGAKEIEPRLQYTYRGSQSLGVVVVGGQPQIAEQDIKRNELEASVGVRFGLPQSLQAEIRVPYTWLNESRATGATQNDVARTSGLGDIELGLSKQLVAEGEGRPNVLTSLYWKTVSGRHDLDRLSPGQGFHQLQWTFTAATRQDPLVFFGALSYVATLERSRGGSDVDPGNAIGIKAAALLAASPDTSLRGGFELIRSGQTRLAGASIPGSGATVGILELGVGTLFTPRALFDVQLGIGVTHDAPDFRLRLSLPVRF